MESNIICLTPVLNEEWIIDKFLKSASLWADKIILSDQGSTDRTLEIARSFPKVVILDNSSLSDFNEHNMRAPLFREARKVEGKRILISLDADEFFTPNFESNEWKTIRDAPVGTRFEFSWLNVLPGFDMCFTTCKNVCGFVDDDSVYEPGIIHVPRQPQSPNADIISLSDISILHLQFVDWNRMERKQLWYQMFERIHSPHKSKIKLFRIYNYTNPPLEVDGLVLSPVNNSWIKQYMLRGIDLKQINRQDDFIWDQKIIKYIRAYGFAYFKLINLNVGYWDNKAHNYGTPIDRTTLTRRPNIFYRFLLIYLNKTQKRRNRLFVRFIDKILVNFFHI